MIVKMQLKPDMLTRAQSQSQSQDHGLKEAEVPPSMHTSSPSGLRAGGRRPSHGIFDNSHTVHLDRAYVHSAKQCQIQGILYLGEGVILAAAYSLRSL